MNRTIKRTITITITETWTIVWTATDDPLPQSPVTADEAPNSEVLVRATAAGRRKPVRRRRAKDKQNRPTDESHPILSRRPCKNAQQ